MQQGQDASFKCLIHDGATPISLEWKTRNQELEDNVHISPNGSVITIVGTRPSNHGAYRCVASNAYGVAQSVVNLSVHGPPTVSVLPEGSVRVKMGKDVTLECVSSGGPLLRSLDPGGIPRKAGATDVRDGGQSRGAQDFIS